MKTFKTLLLREYWEHRAFLWAPLIVSGVFVVFGIMGLIIGNSLNISGDGVSIQQGLGMMELVDKHQVEIVNGLLLSHMILFSVFMATLFFVTFFYSLGCLYDEKRDRSILFWKSMPVSDTTTVLSKVTSAFVTACALTLPFIILTQIIWTIVGMIVVWINGGDAISLVWSNTPLVKVIFSDVVAVVFYSLWMAPILGWCLLVSSYAKKGAFLISILAPAAVILIEALVLRSSHFALMIGDRFQSLGQSTEQIFDGNYFGQLSEPSLWVGIVLSAGFVAGSIYLRRYKDDSY